MLLRRRGSSPTRLVAALAAALVMLASLLSVAPAVASADTVDEIHANFGDDPGHSVVIAWRGAASLVAYGTDTSYGQTATPTVNSVVPVDISGPFEHVLLTGLNAGTVYHYSIDGGPDHQVETAPTGDFTWDDIGDTGSTYDSYDAATGTGCNDYWMARVWQQIAAEQPDFVSHGGDLSYANECGAGAVHQFFDDIAPIATMRAWEQSWGNHEYGAASGDAPPGTPRDSMANYKGRLFLANPQTVPADTSTQVANPGCPSPIDPTQNGCQGDDWGYYQVGHVLIIEYPEPWKNAQSTWEPAADQLMAQAESDPDIWFIVTTGHRPAYSASAAQVDPTITTAIDDLGDKYSPAARPDGKYVLNIAHHMHAGEVFAAQHGVVNITNGGGGTEGSTYTGTAPGLVYRTGHFEHLHITVTGGTMRVDMICGPVWPKKPKLDPCTMGSVLYSVTLTSPVAPGAPPPTTTQWVGNPGFDGGSKAGWTGLYNNVSRTAVVRDSTGNWRLRLSTTSTTGTAAGVNNAKPFWVDSATVAGTTYTATAQAAPSVAGLKAYIVIRETTPSGAGVGYATARPLALNTTGALTPLTPVTYQAKNSGDTLRFSVVVSTLRSGQTVDVDNLGLTSSG